LGSDEFESESGGGVEEAGEFLTLHFFGLLAEYFRIQAFLVLKEMPEDARQFVCHQHLHLEVLESLQQSWKIFSY
jgi:hypothetical protein